jgi:hypothetical protein
MLGKKSVGIDVELGTSPGALFRGESGLPILKNP